MPLKQFLLITQNSHTYRKGCYVLLIILYRQFEVVQTYTILEFQACSAVVWLLIYRKVEDSSLLECDTV